MHRRPIVVAIFVLLNLCWGAASAVADDLTKTEKAEVRRLLGMMHTLFNEDCGGGTTLDGLLNPGTEATSLSCYKTIGGGIFSSGRDTTLSDIYWQYSRMLRENRICKTTDAAGGSTTMSSGLGTPKVFISGPQLTTARTGAVPRDKAFAKFDLVATFVNEAAHVFQKTEPFFGGDLTRCEMERDSDCLMIKYLDSVINRLESAPGVPHTTRAGVAAEGVGGFVVSECLRRAGVSSAADIANVHQRLRVERSIAQDRKDNLFGTQIAFGTSWRTFYYGGRYRSRLAAQVQADRATIQTTRQFTIKYGTGMRTFTVPADGKRIASIRVNSNKDSCLFVRVITQAADGRRCIYIWTDTDKDGLPELAGGTTTVLPAPANAGRARRVVELSDAYEILRVPDSVGFQEGFMIHDQTNGWLVAYETDATNTQLTGNFLEVVDDALFADPDLGDATAGGFSNYVLDQFDSGLAQEIMIFSNEPHVGQFNDAITMVVPFDPFLGGGTPLGPVPLAEAWLEHGNFGPEELPENANGELVVHSVPLDGVDVILFSQALPPFLLGTDQNGISPGQPSAPLPDPDIATLFSVGTARQLDVVVPRLGQAGPEFDGDLNGDGLPDLAVVAVDPPALLVWNLVQLPLPPIPPQNRIEIRLEGPDAPLILDPDELYAPGGPLEVLGQDLGVHQVLPIPGTNPPLVAQSFHDFDASGSPDDALLVVRFPGQPHWDALVFSNNLGQPFPSFQLPLPPGFEPGTIEYPDFGADGDDDVQINAFGAGQPLCFENNLDGTLQPVPCAVPCPADLNGDGILDNGDIQLFLILFLAGDILADLNGDGILDNGDIQTFLALFLGGC